MRRLRQEKQAREKGRLYRGVGGRLDVHQAGESSLFVLFSGSETPLVLAADATDALQPVHDCRSRQILDHLASLPERYQVLARDVAEDKVTHLPQSSSSNGSCAEKRCSCTRDEMPLARVRSGVSPVERKGAKWTTTTGTSKRFTTSKPCADPGVVGCVVSSAPYRYDSGLPVRVFFPRDPLPRPTLPRRARSGRPRRIALLVRDARLVARVRDPSCRRLAHSARVRVLRYDVRRQVAIGGDVRRRLLVHGFEARVLPSEARLTVERERQRLWSLERRNGEAVVESTRSRTTREESLSRERKGRIRYFVGRLSELDDLSAA